MGQTRGRFLRTPTPACRVDRVAQAAEQLIGLIRRNHAVYGIGTFVFVDEHRNAYAISEDRPIAQTWIREHPRWLVGRYDPPGRAVADRLTAMGLDWSDFLTVEGLAGDLEEHLDDIEPMKATA